VEPDLEPCIPQQPVCINGVLYRTAPAVDREDAVFGMLDAQLDLGYA